MNQGNQPEAIAALFYKLTTNPHTTNF